jgi:hypothetical protein
MADQRRELDPHEAFLALMDSFTPERLAEIDRKLEDPNYRPREGVFRDDPDPFGRNWDWLLTEPEGERSGVASE